MTAASQCGRRANAGHLTTVWCWGHNHNGQLGDGTTVYVVDPKQIGDPDHYVTVSVGGLSVHTLRQAADNSWPKAPSAL
jgi:hypothetical protein